MKNCLIKFIASSVCLIILCGCKSNPVQRESNDSFQMLHGPKLYSENKAKFFEISFRDVNANREVRLVVEYEELPDEPLTDFDLMRGIQIHEGGHIMSYRTKWDPWGPREQSDGGLLGDLMPEETQLRSRSPGNYECLFTESGIGTTSPEVHSIIFNDGKFAEIKSE